MDAHAQSASSKEFTVVIATIVVLGLLGVGALGAQFTTHTNAVLMEHVVGKLDF